MKMMIAQKTDVGLEREDNQDDMGWFSLPAGEVVVVADGMGGEAGGREAAKMAISAIRESFEKGGDSIPDLLKSSIIEANQRIHEKGTSGDPRYHKMGTTVVVLVVRNNKAYIAHVGDSRIYLYRDGELKRMTQDHSQVQQMVDDGIIAPSDAEGHPDANIIYRALGAEPEVEPEVRVEPVSVLPNDQFLLCTDGLCELVRDNEIEEIFGRGGSAENLCGNLVSAALRKGGHDNVTVQIVRFEGERLPANKCETQVNPIVDTNNIKTKAYIAAFFILAALLGGGVWWYLTAGPSAEDKASRELQLPLKEQKTLERLSLPDQAPASKQNETHPSAVPNVKKEPQVEDIKTERNKPGPDSKAISDQR